MSADRITVIECYAFNDTTAVMIDGSTDDATRYLKITCPPGQRHAGKWDAAKYNLKASSGITLNDNYIRIEWLQIEATSTRAIAQYDAAGDNRIENCIMRGGSGTAAFSCVWFGPGGASLLRNSVVTGHTGPGVYCSSYGGGTVAIENCTICNNTTYGIQWGGQTLTVKNTYCGGNGTNAYNGTMTLTTCAHSSATSFTGSTASIAYSTANFVNVTAGSEDLHLQSGASATLLTGGTDLSGSFTTDIDGDTRSDWGIGADEYVIAAFTSTAALTLPKAVAAAVCTFTPPTFTSSAGLTLPAAVAAASASHAPPTYSASAALDLPAAVAAATATHTTPTYTGSAALTLPPAVAEADATSTAPTFTSSAALDLPAAIAEAAATHTPPSYTATAALDLPAAIASAAATHVGPVFTASAALDLPAIVAAASATFATATFTASAALTLPAAIAAAECQHTTPTYNATAALVLAPAVAAASATYDSGTFNCWTGTIRTPWEVYELDGDGVPEIGNGPTLTRNPATPPYFTTGLMGQCLTSNRAIESAGSMTFSMAGKFSVGMWVLAPIEPGWEGIVGTSVILTGASAKRIQIEVLYNSATEIKVWIRGATTWSQVVTTQPDQFHHYTVCVDPTSGTSSLFVDGTLIASHSFTLSSSGTGSIFAAERSACLDQIAFAEHAWTASEIAHIYNSGSGREYSTWQRSLSLPAAIASADATSTPPIYTASAALTAPAAVAEAAATFAAPVFTASAGLILPAAIAESTATFTGPVYTASADLDLPAAIVAASATYTPITFTASASLTLAPAIASSSIAFTGPVFTAEAAIEIPAAEASAIATHSTPAFTATVAISLPALQATAIAVFSLNSALLPGDSVWIQAGPGAVSFSSTGNRSSLWVPAGPADASFTDQGSRSSRWAQSGPGDATIQPKESD